MARAKGKALERQREELKAAKVAAARRAERRKALFIAGGAVAALAIVAVVLLLQPPAPGLAVATLGNDHIDTVDQPHVAYNSRPPSSGPHLGSLAPWGEIDRAVSPELWVHNLEDGGVALVYNCEDGCPDIVDGLRGVLEEFPGRNLLLMPYADIVDFDGVPHKAAAVAWNRLYYFDDFELDTADELLRFVRAYEGINNHVGASTPLGG